jgi:hypothetical protein
MEARPAGRQPIAVSQRRGDLGGGLQRSRQEVEEFA